jgi:hypothetical protein
MVTLLEEKKVCKKSFLLSSCGCKDPQELFSVLTCPKPVLKGVIEITQHGRKRSRKTRKTAVPARDLCVWVVINLSSFALGLHQITRRSAGPEQEAVVRRQSAGDREREDGNA